MGANKFEEHEEHDAAHDEPWLVSYADMMTLLFGFFVLMYSFASKDKADQWEKVRADVAQYFGGEYITPYDQLVKDIERAIKDTPLEKEIEKNVTPEGLEITFRSTVLFESGKEMILPGALIPMNALASVIIDRKDEVGMVVEGHTDDSPIATEKFPSNWELSAGRASTVVRLFERLGFPRDRVHAVAFSDTKPRMPNRDEAGVIIPDNQARNRRVVIKLFSIMKKNAAGLPVSDTAPAAPKLDAHGKPISDSTGKADASAKPATAATPAAAPSPSAAPIAIPASSTAAPAAAATPAIELDAHGNRLVAPPEQPAFPPVEHANPAQQVSPPPPQGKIEPSAPPQVKTPPRADSIPTALPPRVKQ